MVLCAFSAGLLSLCNVLYQNARSARSDSSVSPKKPENLLILRLSFCLTVYPFPPCFSTLFSIAGAAGCGKYCGKVAALAARSFPAPPGAAPAPLGVRGRSGADTVSITVLAVVVPLFPASSPLYTIKKNFDFLIDKYRNLCYTVCENEFLRRFFLWAFIA